MDTAIMIALFAAGFGAAFVARVRFGDTAGRLVFGLPVVATGLAFIAVAIIGGRLQRDFLDILPTYISPVILGLALGFALTRGHAPR